MTRIADTFARLKAEGRKGLVGYLTVGDPDMEASERDVRTAIENGVDILELGVPFSDPTADGPIIQAASLRALKAGTTVCRALELVRRLRADYTLPIVLFGYCNPFYRYGFDRLATDAAAVGADAFLVVDLPHEEADELRGPLGLHGLDFIPLIAPTTGPARAAAILRDAGGFVYYIMVTGVTGTREGDAADIARHVAALRGVTALPIAVGFGVSRGAQAREVAAAADAVVVGSALVRAARESRLAEQVRELREGLGG
jgi:tryptophan synthase alpha chain